jgi:hypothetical protein
VSLIGAERAKARLGEACGDALESLECFSSEADFLREIVRFISERSE